MVATTQPTMSTCSSHLTRWHLTYIEVGDAAKICSYVSQARVKMWTARSTGRVAPTANVWLRAFWVFTAADRVCCCCRRHPTHSSHSHVHLVVDKAAHWTFRSSLCAVLSSHTVQHFATHGATNAPHTGGASGGSPAHGVPAPGSLPR
jgi:hypothetical protein